MERAKNASRTIKTNHWTNTAQIGANADIKHELSSLKTLGTMNLINSAKNPIGREYEYQTLWHVACMLLISKRTKRHLVLELACQKKKK